MIEEASSATSSATGSFNVQTPFSCVKPLCAAALMFVVVTSTAGTVSVPQQTPATNPTTILSTDNANKNSYNNGLWLEGTSVMSADKAQNLARLLEIEQLQDNWNENGASCFSKNILSFAREIVMSLLIQPAIFPTARDSIQFEYENELGDYLELEIFEDKRVKVFSFDHAGKALTEEISYDSINKVVSGFYGRNI